MLAPMLASLTDAPLDDPAWVYEPKYDGIRAIAEIAAGGRTVRLWSRLGNEKTRQFPEVVAALQAWAASHEERLVLDGEIVALEADGRPAGFQKLQGRIHVLGMVKGRRHKPANAAPPAPRSAKDKADAPSAAFIAFDLLRVGEHDLRGLPLTDRRELLEQLLRATTTATLRLSEQVAGHGEALQARAVAEGWEGLIAKRADSRYLSGKRSPDWRKLKLVQEQEFVVGGWTEPRHSRSHFGALLLGVHDDSTAAAPQASRTASVKERRGRRAARAPERLLTYVGHVGTGFNERELTKLMSALRKAARATTPFTTQPASNERPHWVEPTLVVQVRFTEWTADGVLRHPVYLGLRDDKSPADVRREQRPSTPLVRTPSSAVSASPRRQSPAGRRTERVPPVPAATAAPPTGERSARPHSRQKDGQRSAPSKGRRRRATNVVVSGDDLYAAVIGQLQAIEQRREDGLVELPDGATLKVTNLHKVFWPRQKLTKGDLLRYYTRVAPCLLPVIADRPLVMKRYPNGVAAKPFYQHRVDDAPAGVRVETVASDDARAQIIGGSLLTLLYTTQLAAISQDPWFSRVESPLSADFVALDLDPPEGADFAKVLAVALWVREALDELGVPSGVKTSGADGLHIYVPLRAGTPFDTGQLFAELVATMVAERHPREATVERSVRARGSRIYVDFMQNGRGKTLASAYSARASDYAGVSTPVTWEEVERGIRRESFTIETVPERLAAVGDLWAALRAAKGADLPAIVRRAASAAPGRGRAR